MSKDNTVGAAKEHRIITVKEFLTYLPTHEQCVGGKIKVVQSQVEKLRPKIRAALRNGQMPISIVKIGKNTHIIAGHTRQAAAGLEVAAGNLEESFAFEVTVEKENPTMAELSELVARANGQLTRAKALIHATRGHTDISVKVVGPVFEALLDSGLNESMAANLAGKLGGIFNNEHTLLKDLAEGRTVDISGPDIYDAKNYAESNSNFLDAEVRQDLRPYKSLIKTRIAVAAELIEEMYESGLWKEKLGNSKNLVYTLSALAFRQQLVRGNKNSGGRVSTGKVKKTISESGRKLHSAVTKYNANPKKNEDTILRLFGSED